MSTPEHIAIILEGNKMTKIIKHKMVTPRGYRYDRK